MIEDLKNKTKHALKLQDEHEMASIEISTMRKVTSVFDANKDR